MSKLAEIVKALTPSKDTIAAVAPTLATALGGPLAGLAVNMVSKALTGKEQASADQLLTAVMNPDNLVKLRQIEADFKTKMAELEITEQQIAATDRDSARKMQVELKSYIPGALAVLITVGFFGILLGMMLGNLSIADTPALMLVLGALTAAWGSVVNYYFGSSAGSARKDDTIRGAVERG